jgi:hypothetical protein
VYEVDDRDTVVELLDVPSPDIGAPLPHLICDEHHVLLAYLINEPDPAWDGSYVNVVGPDTQGYPVAFVRFDGPYAHMFGPPNDEAFDSHPLADRGLEPYAVFEVKDSSWLRRLERMNSVHPYHDRVRFMANRQRTAATVLVCQGVKYQWLPRPLSLGVRRGRVRQA